MLLTLPQPIQTLLDVLDELAMTDFSLQDEIGQLSTGVSAVLDVLALLIGRNRILLPARRALMTLGVAAPLASDAATELHKALLRSDRSMGADWGGFSRLFEAAIEEGEIYVESDIRLEGIDPVVCSNLSALQATADGLHVLQGIADSLLVASENAAACMVLDCLRELLHKRREFFFLTNKYIPESLFTDWLTMRGCSAELAKTVALRAYVNLLTPQVLLKLHNPAIARAFCLWFLATTLTKGTVFEGHSRRLVDTLLRKAQLAPLAVFEGIINC